MRFVLEFVRTTESGDPFAFHFGLQRYVQRSPGGTYQEIALDWDEQLLADLAARRTSESAELTQRLGHHMRSLLPGWPALANDITEASLNRLVEVVIRSAAAELYLLPWELLTVESGQYVGALPNVLIRYAWPGVATRSARAPDRILFAWSAADKPVPRSNHAEALSAACAKAGVALDILPHVSASSLSETLAKAKSAGRPFSTLHFLCHGIERDGAFELLWDGDDNAVTHITADRLRDLLAPHADDLSVVTLCACDSGNAGQPDSHLGSVARALHRIKIPAVIGSRYRLSKPGSVAFADVFYQRLLADRTGVPAAFLTARRHLRERSDLADPRDWMSIRLYTGTDELSRRMTSVLPAPTIPRRRPRTPAAMLHAHYQVVPFFEPCRRAELDALQAWLDSRPEAPSIRLFTGPGGTGKTRLFIEWCTRLRTRGWDAGFLEVAAHKDELDALLASERDTFVVIDYAEMHPELFATLSAMLVAHGERFHVALLARNAGDWWQSLKQRDAELGDCLAEYQPLQLTPVQVHEDQRASAFAEACRAFANARGHEPGESRPVALGDRRFSRMLYIHMAALATVDGEQVPVRKLLGHAVTREQQVWLREWAGPTDRDRVAQAECAARVVAAITLRGGARNAEEAQAIATRADGPVGDFVRVLRDLYPSQGSGSYLGGLEPDLLGETLVARVLADAQTPTNYLKALFADADQDALRTGFTMLGRIAIEDPEQAGGWVADVLGVDVAERAEAALDAALAVGEYSAFSPLGRVLTAALEQAGTREVAQALEGRLPELTVSLKELSCWVETTLLRSLPAGDDETIQLKRGSLLNSLSNRYALLGQPVEAMETALEAVQIFRALVETHPDSFLLELATSLHNLGNRYATARQLTEAIEATKEAVALRRALAKARPDAFLPDLAMSLNNLGARYRELGNHYAAMYTTEEATRIRRSLVKAHSDAFHHDLAMGLNNLSLMYMTLRMREEAHEAADEAVQHYRALAKARPDAFLPDLAIGLNNLSLTYGRLGLGAAAREASLEGAKYCRALAQAHHTYLPLLAINLDNLGAIYSCLGQREEGLMTTVEAVQHFRTLVKNHSNTFLPNLATSLSKLSMQHSELGQREEAVSAAREAVHIYCKLASQLPAMFMADLQRCTSSLADRLRSVSHEPDQDIDMVKARQILDHLSRQ